MTSNDTNDGVFFLITNVFTVQCTSGSNKRIVNKIFDACDTPRTKLINRKKKMKKKMCNLLLFDSM